MTLFVLILCMGISGFLGAVIVYGPLNEYLWQNETAREFLYILVSAAIYFCIIRIGQLLITFFEYVLWRIKHPRRFGYGKKNNGRKT